MKKRNLIIALGALTILTSCGENDSSTSTPIGTNEENLKASDFATKFNAKVNASIKKGTTNVDGDYTIDYASDHVSYISVDAKGQFFEKDSNGGVNLATLDEHNEKSTETVLGEQFDEAFPNAFVNLAADHANENEVDLAANNTLNDLGKSFVKLFLKGAPLKEITEATGSISFNESVALAMTLKDVEGTLATLTATFVKPTSYQETKLKTLPETDESKALKVALDKIKEGNYTVKIKEGEAIKETLYVNSDRLLDVEDNETKGYLKTETGFKVLAVDGETVKEDGTSTDLFSSLLPDYDFAGEVIINGSVSPLVDEDDVLTHLQFATLSSYFQNADMQTLALTADKKALVLTLKNGDKTTTCEWSNIGETTLPVDITKITEAKTWESEGYTEIGNYLKAILGNDADLPYWDTGAEWTIEAHSDTEGTLTISSEISSEDERTNLVGAYASLMKKAGYSELTEEDRKDLDNAGLYLMGTWTDFTSYHTYAISSSIVEIFDNGKDEYMPLDSVSIIVSPDVR